MILVHLVALALIVAAVFFGSAHIAKMYSEKSQRIIVWRVQLLFLLGLTFVATLFHAIGFHGFGKFVTTISLVALIHFLWENFDRYVITSQEAKRIAKNVAYILMALILLSLFF